VTSYGELIELWHASYDQTKIHIFNGNTRHISTSPFFNSHCRYGFDEEKKLLMGKLTKINFDLLANSHLLADALISDIPTFRCGSSIVINEYGDFINDVHIANIQLIISKNPLVRFDVKTRQDVAFKGNNVILVQK